MEEHNEPEPRAAKHKPAMEFLVQFMRAHPDATYADAATAAHEAGHTIYPINWGRAQLMLGRVQPGQGRSRARRAARAAAELEERSAGARGGPARGSRRPRGVLSLPIAKETSPATLQEVVDAINQGMGAALVYRGDGWVIEIG